MSAEESLYQRGMRVRREVLGDDYVEAALARMSPLDDTFQRLITEVAWGSVWARPELDRRTRSLVTVAILAALGRHDELALHLRASQRIGVPHREITQTLLHVAVYAGVPAANSAMSIARRELGELDDEMQGRAGDSADSTGQEYRTRIEAGHMSTLGSALYSDSSMASLWSVAAFVERVLAFEAALARAESRAGVIPPEAADAIRDAVNNGPLDTESLAREAAHAGSPALPILRALGERIAPPARDFVHWGATSQDAIDTALVLTMLESLDVLRSTLFRIGERCATLAEAHRRTVMAGRTLLQQATPITFGLKAARWLVLITRQWDRLTQAQEDIGVVQLGGATGTLAALGDQGPRVTEFLAEELGLAAPLLPWHAERDRVAGVAADVGIVAGATAKIAADLVLLAQTEVAEASDTRASDKGGSSAMPHKRNPTDAIAARAAARLALGVVPVLLAGMEQEHERAAGACQAEWAALADLFGYCGGAASRLLSALDGLEPDPARMRDNIDRSGGLIQSEALMVALARHVGRDESRRIAEDIASHAHEAGGFARSVMLDERVRKALTAEEISRALDPATFLGSADVFIDRAIASFRALVDHL